nr:MAG TPA: hypothetical protein [Caudoviricetes sp.]
MAFLHHKKLHTTKTYSYNIYRTYNCTDRT